MTDKDSASALRGEDATRQFTDCLCEVDACMDARQSTAVESRVDIS